MKTILAVLLLSFSALAQPSGLPTCNTVSMGTRARDGFGNPWICNGTAWQVDNNQSLKSGWADAGFNNVTISGTLTVSGSTSSGGADAGFNNLTANALTVTTDAGVGGNLTATGTLTGGQVTSTGNIQATASAGSGAFTATQGLFSASTASLGFYGGNGATFGTAGQSTAALQAIFPNIPQEGFDTTRGVFAQNDGDGGWQAVCTQTNNYCNFGLDGGFNNLTAGGQNVLDNHAAAQWSSECGSDAGTAGQLSVAFGTAFGSPPVCLCNHVRTTNDNTCTISAASIPATGTARFQVDAGATDIIEWCCFGPK